MDLVTNEMLICVRLFIKTGFVNSFWLDKLVVHVIEFFSFVCLFRLSLGKLPSVQYVEIILIQLWKGNYLP